MLYHLDARNQTRNLMNPRLLLSGLGLFGCVVFARAQVYNDYIGAGHSDGISVTTSSNQNASEGVNTVNGQGLDQHLRDASRFLGQATTGVNYQTIEQVAGMGLENWIDAQFQMPQMSFQDSTWMVWEHYKQAYLDQWGEALVVDNNNVLPFSFYWRMAWWHNTFTGEDYLRQKVALALSEILVISENSDLEAMAQAIGDYYDVLYHNAFGNYRDILEEVTYHPAMGYYLSHLNNERSNEELNIHPDENYAREIMQLFSIGLYELNPDGTIIEDENGVPVPTYDNNDIKEFAKVFTGLGPSAYWWIWEDLSGVPVTWDNPANTIPTIVAWEPMVMFEAWHEPGEKFLLNGQVVPSGQSGDDDIQDALDNLFNHPNVGPFIGTQLIKRLVKSNPTPEYVERVTNAFNDNGEGVRGDLSAVVKAILMDPEARDCSWIDEIDSGKMREPMVRYIQLLKAFDAANESGQMWSVGFFAEQGMGQHPMAAPSVFNFFLPDYAPPGPVSDAGKVAPEFELLNSATAIDYINLIGDMLLGNVYMDVTTDPSLAEIGIPAFDTALLNADNYVNLDFASEEDIASDTAALVEHLDILLTGGIMSDASKAAITEAADFFFFDDNLKVKVAIYMVMLSPDYIIQK